MVGWFSFGDGKLEVSVVTPLGVPLLKVVWPSPKLDGGRWHQKRLAKGLAGGATYLKNQGCRRVLCDKTWPYAQKVYDLGLRPVEVAPFCRAMAVPLVMAALEQKGVPSRKACVHLVGQRVDADMTKTAMTLCPRVHSLIIEAPYGGEQLATQLQRRFGVAILKEGVPHVTVAFSPLPGVTWGEDVVTLFGGQPWLGGFALRPTTGSAPTELEELSLLTLLWEGSGGDIGHVAVVPISFDGI